MRPASIAMLGLAFGAIAILFHVSYLVSGLADELAQVNGEIARGRDEIHVLRAEWSFLNRAERLQALGARYLELAPLGPGQIVAATALPTKQAAPSDGFVVAATQPGTLAGRPRAKPPTPRRAATLEQSIAAAPTPAERTLDDVLATLAFTGGQR